MKLNDGTEGEILVHRFLVGIDDSDHLCKIQFVCVNFAQIRLGSEPTPCMVKEQLIALRRSYSSSFTKFTVTLKSSMAGSDR